MKKEEKYKLRSANIELTLKCNMFCLHCGSSAGSPRQNELNKDEFVRLFEDLASLGCQELDIGGGEPFLNPDWLVLAQKVNELGMEMVFYTNGFCVNEKIIEGLKSVQVSQIAVSLDAARSEIHDRIRQKKGAFEKAIKALFLFRDAGFKTGAITTITKANLKEFPKIKELLSGEGVSWWISVASYRGDRFPLEQRISCDEFYEVGRFISWCQSHISREELPVAGCHELRYFSEQFSKENKGANWNGCSAGIYKVGVMSNGGVKACLSLPDNFIEDNIRTRSIIDIWHDPGCFKLSREFKKEYLEGFCRECLYGELCRAGCKSHAFSLSGSIYNNPDCIYRIKKGYKA